MNKYKNNIPFPDISGQCGKKLHRQSLPSEKSCLSKRHGIVYFAASARIAADTGRYLQIGNSPSFKKFLNALRVKPSAYDKFRVSRLTQRIKNVFRVVFTSGIPIYQGGIPILANQRGNKTVVAFNVHPIIFVQKETIVFQDVNPVLKRVRTPDLFKLAIVFFKITVIFRG